MDVHLGVRVNNAYCKVASAGLAELRRRPMGGGVYMNRPFLLRGPLCQQRLLVVVVPYSSVSPSQARRTQACPLFPPG